MEPPEALHDGIYIPFTPRWKFDKKFAILPHRCYDTGELIWFKHGYYACFEEQFGHFSRVWLTEGAFVMRSLKGEVRVRD